MLQVHYLREALSALRPGKIGRGRHIVSPQAASAISQPINFSTGVTTKIRSVEEINTAPTSFQHNGPAWMGSTVTAPWSGLGSTADAIVSGTYDGSNGQGTLTFKVDRAGTHGTDDLRIKVFDGAGVEIEAINIGKSDPLNQPYQLSNGLSITLSAGNLVKNDLFEVNTALLSTSYTPNNPGWTGSTASPSIGGVYNGSQGTGELTFRVDVGGVHGVNDLRVKVYAPNNTLIQTIDIRKSHAIDRVYSLSNGLTFSLGAGKLIKNESFNVAVDANNPNNYTSAPEWNFSSATPTLTGTYDGSNGTGTLTFENLNDGVHGVNDLNVRVYAPDGSTLENIFVSKNDPINKAYVLSNGLSVTFSAGNFIKNETFSVDVAAVGSFSTAPNPIQSTAQPELSGVYDGSLGTDLLEFTVTQGGTRGTNNLTIDVRTSNGTLVDTLNILASDSLDKVYALSNGLSFTLGAGYLELHETFDVSLNHVVPTSVDANLSFNGTGVNDAKLEDQFSIIDGTFKINGNLISVFANDSINSVINRINKAGINVAASFDAASETIVMTHALNGPNYDIVLSDDTSGFLAATKLLNATSTPGTGDETYILSELEMMAGVTNGNLQINGISIGLDVNVDSLQDVLSRIEVMVPDVEVDFDSNTGRLSLVSTSMESLQISSGGTGFFAALGINEGVYEPTEGFIQSSKQKGFSYQTRIQTAKAINEFARRFNAIFEDKHGVAADPFIQAIREELKTAVSAAVSSRDSSRKSPTGIKFNFDDSTRGPIQFTDAARQQFVTGLKSVNGATEYNKLFFDDEGDGLVDRMMDITKLAERKLGFELARTGSLVNVWA